MKKLYFLFLGLTISIGYSQNPGDIVITEFMNDTDLVSDTVGEWLEIYNTTGSAIDLDGWVLRDDGSDSYTFTETLLVPANSYFVLGRGPNDASNGGVILDFSYGDGVFTLGNGEDEIVLESPTAVEIDRVNYGSVNDFPDDGPGTSIILDPTLSISSADNNDGTNWCLSTTSYGDGDLGTPGSVNDACTPVCETSLGASDVACDTTGAGSTDDTYTATLSYSGAATGEAFVVSVSPEGTVDLSGGNPTSDASGTITITGITEGTDITITIDNTADGGLCTLTSDITSPMCLPTGSVDLELVGVIDFTVPSGGSDGKAIHLVATADIADLSEYGLGVANNGGGTDGQEYTFPTMAVSNGDHILLARSLTAMESYFTTAGYNLFDVHLEDASEPSQNGDDAIELFKNGTVVETFGDVNCDPNASGTTCPEWEYTDAWAYKSPLGSVWPAGWTYGAVDCTDGSTTTFDSSCLYPFMTSLSTNDFTALELSVYPNPVTNGYINIVSNKSETIKVTMFDVLGKQINVSSLINNRLDVSTMKSGIYFLRILQDNNSVTKKIIIK